MRQGQHDLTGQIASRLCARVPAAHSSSCLILMFMMLCLAASDGYQDRCGFLLVVSKLKHRANVSEGAQQFMDPVSSALSGPLSYVFHWDLRAAPQLRAYTFVRHM